MSKIPVGLLGCTGLVGQTYVKLLENHPFFELVFLHASARSQGKSYGESVNKTWFYKGEPPFKDHIIEDLSQASKCALIFSALPSELSKKIDPLLAQSGIFIITHGSPHRKDPLVPVIIPEINPLDIDLVKKQREEFGSSYGGMLAKPNCSLQSYLMPLYPIMKHSEVHDLSICTMQSLSGAGIEALSHIKDPQLIPFIEGEEEKSEFEPQKILKNSQLNLPRFVVKCTRIPTIIGHFASVSFKLKKAHCVSDIKEIWRHYSSTKEVLSLPSTPFHPIVYHERKDAPLVKEHLGPLDMRIHVGQLHQKSDTYQFIALSNNIARGAASGGLQLAELAFTQRYIHGTDSSRSTETSRLLSLSENSSPC